MPAVITSIGLTKPLPSISPDKAAIRPEKECFVKNWEEFVFYLQGKNIFDKKQWGKALQNLPNPLFLEFLRT